MSNIITKQFQSTALHFTEDAYFNATEAAALFGKEPHEWLRLLSTREYIEALERSPMDQTGNSRFENCEKYVIGAAETDLVLTIRGGSNPGTWLHPDLIVVFARWLSPDFAVWCDRRIKELLLGNYSKAIAETELLKADLATKQAIIEDLKDDVRDLEMGKKHDHVRISTLAARCDALKDESTHLRQVNKYIPKELTLDIDEDSSHMAELRRTSERLQVYVHKLKMKNMTLANSIKGLTHDLHMNLAKAHMYGELVFIVDTLCAMFINHPEARRYRSRIDELQEHLSNLERNNI